jgi:HEAT repeat protein
VGDDFSLELAEKITEFIYSTSQPSEFLVEIENNLDIAIRIGQPIVPLLIEAFRMTPTRFWIRGRDTYRRIFQAIGVESGVSVVTALEEGFVDTEEARDIKIFLLYILREIPSAIYLPVLFNEIEQGETEAVYPLGALIGYLTPRYRVFLPYYFRRCLGHPESMVRRNTIAVLGIENLILKFPEFLPSLIEMLTNDSDPEVRSTVAQVLGGSGRGFEALVTAFRQEEIPEVRGEIGKALGHFPFHSREILQELVPALNINNPGSLREGVLDGIKGLFLDTSSPATLDGMFDILLERAVNPELRPEILRLLGGIISAREVCAEVFEQKCLNEWIQSPGERVDMAAEVRNVFMAQVLWKSPRKVSELLESIESEIGIQRRPFSIYIWERTRSGEDYVIRSSLAPYINELCEGLLSEDFISARVSKYLLAGLGAPAIEPLIERLSDVDPEDAGEIISALTLIGRPAFMPVVVELLDSQDEIKRHYGVEILQGISQITGEAIDPETGLLEMKNLSVDDLLDIARDSPYSLTRAVAWYYLGEKMSREDLEPILRKYIFEETVEGLCVRNMDISKLEMAAILYTEVPGVSDWWERLVDRTQREQYLKLVLRGDFTDERNYIHPQRLWLCSQFAKQLELNFTGEWTTVEREADNPELLPPEMVFDFEYYGAGYFFFGPRHGYGIPLYYARTTGHAFNAVYVGDVPFEEGKYDINNWVLIEPQQDDFSPKRLADSVDVFLVPLYLPDIRQGGAYEGEEFVLTIETAGYRYMEGR